MKKKNSLRLRRALSVFSVVLMLFSQGTPAFANVASTTAGSEVAQDNADTAPAVETNNQENPSNSTESSEGSTDPIPTPVVDKALLKEKYNQLEELINTKGDYRPSTYPTDKINALYHEANVVLNLSEVDQVTIDTLVETITSFLIELQTQLEVKPDKTSLHTLLTKALVFKASEYTPASFKILQNQIGLTNGVLNNEDASAEEVIGMQSSLQKAIDGLTKIEAPKPNPTPKPKPDPQPQPKPQPNKPAINKPHQGDSNKEQSKPNTVVDATTPKQPVQGPNKDGVSSKPLDDNLVVDSLTDSDLNGFELPLLNTLKDKKQGALIAAALKMLNKPFAQDEKTKAPNAFDNLSLPNYLYKEIFGVTLGKSYDEMTKGKEQISLEKAQPGDLLFWQDEKEVNKVAVYLGQGKYMMATDENHEALKEQEKLKAKIELQKDTDTKKEQLKTTSKDYNKTELPGVQIFTIQGYEVNDAGIVKIATNKDSSNGENEESDAPLLSEKYGVIENPSFAIRMPEKLVLTPQGEKTLANYAATVDFKVNPITQRFIDSIADDARELGLKYDVFASVMIAQAILESGSGASGLSRAPYYNLFGIKGSHNGASVAMKTMEDKGNGDLYQITANFRSYPGYKESLEDYVELIRGGISGNDDFYQGVWRSEAGNYLQATDHLMGKYATDTQYSNKLNSIIAAYHLTQYDEPKTPAGTQTGMIIQSRQNIPAYYRNKMIFPAYDGRNYNTSGSYPVGQCTWYVYNRITQLGGRIDNFMGNGGEWGQKGVRLGYKTSDVPKAGYAVSFHPGIAGSSSVYGHVAFVEAVGPDGILVSEGNVVGPTTVSYRIIPNNIARSNNVTYVAPK
ncbi:N-acetylmuramoyl-L-alanine amidase [Enterococcus saigonensis]|uniref:N-acetylmuramoyl-L-alanine amidase n=1 Tax=Enterococcus saigonensis TaxID=1805431 RepID=A0A679ILT4_9ENTE|nr:glucosaminidase domain-containing protein [Enterococcus saigonensis]BCA85671.1 N-acetylmuramoyl-L-alanine amidase [Enterococcus saigonensis]